MGSGRDRWRRLRDGLLAGVVRWLSRCLGWCTWSTAQRLGRGVGRLAWRLGGRDRRRALEHVELAFPELSPAARRDLAARSFEHLGTLLFECLHLWRHPTSRVDEIVGLDGFEHVEAARRDGRPIVILTGHCGNWELLAAAINRHGLPLAVVARGMDDDRINTLLLGLREHFGSQTIERGAPGGARTLLRTLRSGGALGMLIDQDTSVDGDWVPFFGRLAYTPTGAAQIALKQDAAVIPSFIERRPDGTHRATLHAALELPDDIVAATAAMTRTIEEQIRRVPEQWVWMHRRWRRRPPDETSAVA